MFTGIIKHTSRPIEVRKDKNSMELSFPIPKDWKLELGESINIDGICSTIKDLDQNAFSVYYMPETLLKTTMGGLGKDHLFNVERCLTLNDLIGGHLVYGHVDTTAKVTKVEKDQESSVITLALPAEFTKYLIYKGSVAVNGVSLTVINVDSNSFTVSLIPHTLIHTNLGQLATDDSVNIEVDMMAKQMEKLMKKD